MADAIAAVRQSFIGLANGEFEMPTRTVLGGGGFVAMPVRHIPSETAIVKTLSLNFDGRVPAIVGTVTWSDLSSTRQLIADAGAITPLRTGAASGVATDLLAPADASSLVVIGAGGQAADQVRAIDIVRPLRSLVIVSRRLERARALAAQFAGEFPEVRIEVGDDATTAVADAEIVCCATPATEPLFPLEALRADVHVNAIGAYRPDMRELPDELPADSGTVFIDEREATLEESGEIIHAMNAGAIIDDDLVEIGSALSQGTITRSGRTVFKSVGLAVQDWAIARLLAER